MHSRRALATRGDRVREQRAKGRAEALIQKVSKMPGKKIARIAE
jgi:hypothetical protein